MSLHPYDKLPHVIQVMSGFAIVLIVIAIGWLVGYSGILGEHARYSLSMFVFFVATPALLFDKLRETSPTALLGPPLAIAATTALIVGGLYTTISLGLVKTPFHEAFIGGLASSYCNASNLGIPIAIHVLGDGNAIVPLLLFQIAFYGPAVLVTLDIYSAKQAATEGRTGRVHIRQLLIVPLKNPIFLAAVAGIIAGVLHTQQGLDLPELFISPIHLIGQATVPTALMVFGMSLSEQRLLDPKHSPIKEVLTVSVLKTVACPAVAALLAIGVFGLSGHALLTACVVAALPTAQNVYIYASRYDRGMILARDAGVVSTAASFVVIAALAMGLGV